MNALMTPVVPGQARASAPKQTSAFEEYRDQRQRYWNEFAESQERWEWLRGYYHLRLASVFRSVIPPGMRVLELGCGQGDLLAALQPGMGVGIDFSGKMIEKAPTRHPHLEFTQADAHEFTTGEKFDFIILSDLVNDLWDVQ